MEKSVTVWDALKLALSFLPIPGAARLLKIVALAEAAKDEATREASLAVICAMVEHGAAIAGLKVNL